MFRWRILNKFKPSSLPQKISLPFLLIFLGLWITGTLILGEYVSLTLESRKQRKAEELSNLVRIDIERELDDLRKSARLLALKTEVIEAVRQENITQLQQQILPIRGVLEADYINIINQDHQILLDNRTAILKDLTIESGNSQALILAGSDISTVSSSTPLGPPILFGGSPLKDEQGIIGGIELGVALDDELLSYLDREIDGHLIALSLSAHDVNPSTAEDEPTAVIAASEEINPAWVLELSQELAEEHEHFELGVHNHHNFIAQRIAIEGLAEREIELLLVIPKARLNQAKRTLWLVLIIIAGTGCAITSAVSAIIGRRLARPILDLTDVAQQVVQEKDFTLRAENASKDELGLLTDAFNQLVEWAGEYTQALEASAATLESRVEERTQELSETLTQLQDTQSQLIQTEKMSSLGQMVAGIAHEINNPISFIQGNLKPINEYVNDLLELIATYQAEYPNPTEAVLDKQEDIDLEFLIEDLQKILASLKMGTERVRDIVVSLRNYSRLDESAIKDVDIHEGIDSTLLILNHRIKHGVNVVKDYGDLPLVRCSPSQMNQVFTNILANALDAMFEADSQPKQLTITTRKFSDQQVQIRFRDTGPGMSPEVKAKIFDPFFTTKVVGKGTGLGMGICFKIMEQHQGSIAVETAVGQGTALILTLPIDSTATQPTAARPLALV